ncbi:hypothetical protein [Phyllobacterium phragmitis]|uniref:Uncharacterized protein n=1 Tax=Phyllobacterium phragmitis TaxID=2670329 RepID=A0ABQ0H4A5_9HYPH
MSNAVVLSLEGKSDLWLVDFDAGTVAPVARSSDDLLASTVDLRQSEEPIVRGVGLAVAINSAPEVGAGILDK